MPARKIDYHHRAEVFVKADMTIFVAIRNVSKGTQMTPGKAAFISIIKTAEECLHRAETEPDK